jgi:hypothetical protein
MVEGASIVVPLPAGKLGLSFVGKEGNVIVADVKENGAMYGRPIKPGYIVTSIFIGDSEESFTDKKSLVSVISANSEETTRRLKCKIAYKAEIEVTVPSSEGFAISTRKGLPCISKIDASCPLKVKGSVGMIVNKVSIGGYAMAGHDSDAISALLKETEGEPVTLTLLAPKSELSSKSIKFESTKIVELPTGAMKVMTIVGTSVPKVDVGSTVRGILPGMAVQAIRIPNGSQYDDLNAEQFKKVLEETDDIEGRLVNLVPNDYIKASPTLKVYPPALGGSMSELGFSCEQVGTSWVEISSVEDYSDLAGLSSGLKLLELVYEDADDTTRTVSPSSPEELDRALSKSSGCDRYMVFGGLPGGDESITIQLEPGKLGMTFKGAPAVLKGIKETSQILGKGYDISPGMIVTEAIIDGEVMKSPSTTQLTSALVAGATSPDRVITFSME